MQVFWDPYATGVLYGTHWETAPHRQLSHQDVDQYERPSRKLLYAKELLQSTNAQLIQLKELAQATVRFGADKAIVEKLDTLSGQFKSEVRMSRKTLFEYRQEIRVLTDEITQMRKDVFRTMFRGLSKDIRFHLQALAIIQALYERNLDYVVTKMTDAQALETKASEIALSEQEILLRIEPVMLKAFANAGICEAMSADMRSQLQASEQIIDQDTLASQVLVDKTYYNLNDRYMSILERLLSFLSEHGVPVISRSQMNRRILEGLFNNQLDLMCSFNIVQRLERRDVDALIRQKRCQLTDFVKSGEHHYWIHDEGLRVLKEFLKVKDAI